MAILIEMIRNKTKERFCVSLSLGDAWLSRVEEVVFVFVFVFFNALKKKIQELSGWSLRVAVLL